MAKVSGVAIRPGVSKNKRRYSAATLAKAAKRLQARLADPAAPPVPMFTSHTEASADNSMALAGRLTKAWLNEDGSLGYEGELADTDAGRTVGTLAKKGADGKAFLQHVSVRAIPYGVTQDEDGNDEPDDLEIVGLDFTTRPGVDGTSANVESAKPGALITESAEEATYMTDETTNEATADKSKEPYGAVDYADPGYQKDGKKRYPLDTKAHARAAWAYVNMAKNADQYTGAQLKRIKGKIKAACKKFGIDVSAKESVTVGELLTEATAALVEEAYASMNVYNGQASVGVSGSTDDPEQLKALTSKIATAALAALVSLDPDQDGDIDGIDPDDDDDAQNANGPTIPESAGKPAETKEAEMADETKPGASASGTITLTAEALAELVKGAVTEAVAAVAKPAAAESATAAGEVQETAEQKAAREAAEMREAIRTEERAKLIEEQRTAGIARKGLVREAVAQPDFSIESIEDPKTRDAVFSEALATRFAQLSPGFAVALQDAAA